MKHSSAKTNIRVRRKALFAMTCLMTSGALLSSCNSSSPLLDKSKNSMYCTIPTRWVTADDKNPREVQLKEKTIKHIDAFWDEFKKSQSQLSLALDNMEGESGKANKDMLVQWMEDHLAYVDGAISYEFGSLSGKEGHQINFSSGGHDEIMPIIKLLVAKAPKFPNWKFSAHRQAVPLDTVAAAFTKRLGVEVPDFEVSVDASPKNLLDVTINSPKFTADEEDNAKCARVITDLALGEDNKDNWVGAIATKKEPLQGPFSPAANTKLFADVFASKKKQIIDSLPKTPYFKISDFGKSEILHFDLVRKTMNTGLKKLGETLGAGGHFHNEQFTKSGDKFAYLQISKAKDLAAQDKLDAAMKELDAELKKAQVGCVFGDGNGDKDVAYIDVAVVDLEKSIPVLKKFCEQHKFDHDTALRFYDGEWLHEWVGMFDDTHEPKDLVNPWFLPAFEPGK